MLRDIEREHLQTELHKLRPLLEKSGDTDLLSFFDDFLDHEEYGLTLDTIFDYLLQEDVSVPTIDILEQIASLHSLMKFNDDRVVLLRAKGASA